MAAAVEQSSDWANERSDLPVAKRHCSEPARAHQGFNTHSIETSLSPPPSIHHQIKCPWCAKDFEAPAHGAASEYDVLKEHLAVMHPQIANLSAHDIPTKDTNAETTMDDDGDVFRQGSALDTSHIATVTAPATNADATPETNAIASDAALKADSTGALHNKLQDWRRQQAHEYIENRLLANWKLHDAREFNPDYDDTTAELDQTWCYVFDQSKTTARKASVDVPTRPNPYLSSTTEKGEFLKLTPVEDFLNSLKDFETMSTDELHASAANVAHALKTWQDEWSAIEDMNKAIKPSKKTANPRALDPPEVFQDKREAMLYGYKYDPTIHDPKKRDPKKGSLFKCPDPFIQGGFRPTAAQLRKMQADVAPSNPNPDGFKTMMKHGQEYIPKFQDPPLTPFEGRGATSRKRKVPHSEIAALRQMSGHDSSTPALESDIDGQPFKRLTRSIVSKAVETPETKTAPPSPGLRGRGRGARGGRGRGGTLKASSRTAQVPLAKAIASKAVNAPLSAETAPLLSNGVTPSPQPDGLAPDRASVDATGGSASIAPVPKPALAPATPGAPPALAALPPNLVQPGEVVDALELNRRKLLAKSKNPRRTQAMLDHWKRFNKEGRTRNPKRTKAQIEADRLADAERKSKEPQKAPATKTRKRKATSTDTADGSVSKQPRAATTSMAATVSLQPAPIQPATTTSTSIATIAPTPAAIGLPIAHFLPPSAPSRPRSPPSFLAPQNSAPAAVPPRPLQPVLPGFDRNPASSWTGPPHFFSYPNSAPSYPRYGETQFSPPPANPPHRHEAGPPEIMQPLPTYPYDATRPQMQLQKGAQTQRP
ncbi:hypothetical protein UA08_05430 [Talaromyces atroroseus]|uniref:Uncharacterized protein n=1 Tax=Talaromyces atroroseus TaxID=1441469 RepID=A0A225AK08_TALAT|nr:hypothetical protein UA08_05430 [Talaromyces atroroseus]OKL59713.1 hypothetical protein UA08_05430 [Talaromyces atroroseus]